MLNNTIACRFGDCYDQGSPVAFGDHDNAYRHVMTAHNIPTSSSQDRAHAVELLLLWCPFCFTWVSQLAEDIEQHVCGHIEWD